MGSWSARQAPPGVPGTPALAFAPSQCAGGAAVSAAHAESISLVRSTNIVETSVSGQAGPGNRLFWCLTPQSVPVYVGRNIWFKTVSLEDNHFPFEISSLRPVSSKLERNFQKTLLTPSIIFLLADLVSSLGQPGCNHSSAAAGLSSVRCAEDPGLPAVQLPWASLNLPSVLPGCCVPHRPSRGQRAVAAPFSFQAEDFPFVFFKNIFTVLRTKHKAVNDRMPLISTVTRRPADPVTSPSEHWFLLSFAHV